MTTSTTATLTGSARSARAARPPRQPQPPWSSRAWSGYLLLTLALVPIVLPVGPSQMISVDLLNAAALAVFMATVLLRGLPLALPFAAPVFVALVGSVLAMSNATSVTASVLALTKDFYLYLWFVALVTLLRPRGDLRMVRLAWMGSAVFVALTVYVQAVMAGQLSVAALLLSNRERAVGTFTNPNMLADYLLFSIFVTLGLRRELRTRVWLPVTLLLFSALVATKSNGGLISLLSGLAAWALASLVASGMPLRRIAGGVALGTVVVLAAVWMHAELGFGESLVQSVRSRSYVGRMTDSGEARGQIWHRLEETYAHTPLGIGPKNSAEQTLAIGERERPESFKSKEAHNDYLAFAIERGPLGLVGLLLGTVLALSMVLRARPALDLRLGDRAAGGALWAAFIGALIGTSVHSLVIEKLHFRHFWLFLALATAMCLAPADRTRPAEVRS